jgi:hypothetical protein
MVSVALVVTLAGCAGKTAEVAVSVDDRAFGTLSQMKTAKDNYCDAGVLPPASCVLLAKAFIPLWDGYIVLNHALASGLPPEKIKPSLDAFAQAGRDFAIVVAGLQDGHWKVVLMDLLAHLLAGVPR